MAGSSSFSAEERAAMKDRRDEARRAKAANRKAADAEAVQEKIAEMDPPDKVLAEAFVRIVQDVAPALDLKTWYGMPAFAFNGKVLCFFQDAGKFKARYSTLGFNDPAALDDGEFWATSFAITGISEATEQRIKALVTRAVGEV